MRIGMILGCVIVWGMTAGLLLRATPARASDLVYQTAEAFLTEAFPTGVPESRALWVKPQLRAELEQILGRNLGLRVRYWAAGDRTVWVLDEIGRDQPITAGFVVNAGAIENVRVLVFRESRGWEIRHDFFTAQFLVARLSADHKLSQTIDGITGATLSVRAMEKMARAALLLHEHARAAETSLAHAD